MVSLIIEFLSNWAVIANGRGSNFPSSKNTLFSFSRRLRAAFLLLSFMLKIILKRRNVLIWLHREYNQTKDFLNLHLIQVNCEFKKCSKVFSHGPFKRLERERSFKWIWTQYVTYEFNSGIHKSAYIVQILSFPFFPPMMIWKVLILNNKLF